MALRPHYNHLNLLLSVHVKQPSFLAPISTWFLHASTCFSSWERPNYVGLQAFPKGNGLKRYTSTNSSEENRSKTASSSLSEVKESAGKVTIGQKVQQTTKDVYYTGIIVAGVTITGVILYTIFRELFSKESPNGIYSDALRKCKENLKVVNMIGEPIKGYGETTSRGRRRHVSHVEFEQDGVKCMRMKFYIQGSRKKATVHLEVRQNDKKKYEYRYLFVEMDGYAAETVILEDNR